MACSLGDSRFESEPDYFWAQVDLPPAELQSLEFKFVFRGPGASVWTWDDGENRKLSVNGDAEASVLVLPVEKFREGSSGEHDHTGRFFAMVNERKEMSVRPVCKQIVLGSCPRRREHIDRLKSLGITVVMNFQAEEDCYSKCVEGIGMEEDALAIRPLYDKAGIEYVWMPTKDMDTAARAAMLPHASFVLEGLVARGHTVYVHCNAGVGRSVAAVCGYLHYCVGLTITQLQHVVARARTVAYFDVRALESARPHFEAMFGPPRKELQDQKCQLLEAAGFPAA